MIEIRQPPGMEANEFSDRLQNLSPAFTGRMERRNKGRKDDHYVALWDETVAPAPSVAQIQSAARANKARLKALAREVAIEKVAADVFADIDSGVIDTEDKVRNSGKWRTPS